MQPVRHIEQTLSRSWRIPLLVIGVALLVLAGVVTLATLQARERIRAQIAGRDGEVLYAVALLHYAEDVKDGLAGPVMSPGDQLNIALKSSELRGVLGVRLFSPDGRFVGAFPPNVTELDLPSPLPFELIGLRPLSRFHPRAELSDLFYADDAKRTGSLPLLEVLVPLHTADGPLAGIAQFLVEGHSIDTEYARLDSFLTLQAMLAFLAGGTVLVVSLVWAFHRLRLSQRLLAERTENLMHANQELALAAKTSALGAVTAHLIHGLKNPLAGLQNFVTARGTTTETATEDWQQAVASTRRMENMIQQVVNVLREEESVACYEVSLAELEQTVRNRVQPLARNRNVNLATLIQTTAALPNRTANLVALVLVNLIENALQATPSGKNVALTISAVDHRIVFEVRDEGGGFPADAPLFMPCRSSKEGGTGIGLALCKQLANHLGAELELTASTPAGCVFALRLLVPAVKSKPAATTARLG